MSGRRDLIAVSLLALALYLVVAMTGGFQWLHDHLNAALPGTEDEVVAFIIVFAAAVTVLAVLRWRQANDEVRRGDEAEVRYRSLIEQTPATTYTWDASVRPGEASAPYISPQIEGLLGFTHDEWQGDPQIWLRQVHEADRDRVLAEWDRAELSTEPFSCEYRMLSKDGREIWLRDEAAPVATGHGGQPIYQGVLIDITERRRAEDRLAEAEAAYRSLVEQIPAVTYRDQVSLEDPSDATPIYITPQVKDLLGYTPEEWVGDDGLWGKCVHPDDRDRVEEAGDGARASGQPFTAEYRMVRRDSRVIWVREESVLVRDAEGRPLYWQGLLSDITEQKRAEELLREAESRYRALVEQIPAVVYVDAVDEVSTALYVSPQYEKLLGFTQEERIADAGLWARQLHPDDRERVLEESRRTNETREPFRIEYRMLHRDGHVVWVRDEGNLYGDETGKPLFWQGVLLDITERKDAEESLRRRDAILEAVRFAAERFLQAESWKDCIDEVLAYLGSSASVSRVYVFENGRNDAGELTMTERFEWVAEGIASTLGDPDNHDHPYRTAYARWEEVLSRGDAIAGLVAGFPEGERLDLEDEDIVSVAVVPIFLGGDWWGFLGFDECREARAWPKAETDALTAAADILGATMARERAVTRLAEAETRYRILVEQMPAITYIHGPASGHWPSYVSPQVETILGYSPEEWNAEKYWEVMHPDDRERVRAEDLRTEDTGEPFTVEYRQFAEDGRTVWLRDHAVLVRDDGGRALYWQGVRMDITAWKEADEQLRDAEERYRTLVERIPAIVYLAVFGEAAPWLYVSPQAESILGFTPDEWIQDPALWMERIHPDDLERVMQEEDRSRDTGQQLISEYRMIARDGRVVWIRDEAEVVPGPEGHPGLLSGLMYDITDRKLAEERLEEAEAKFRTLVEHIPAMTYIDPIEPEPVASLYFSPQIEALLGYPSQRWMEDPNMWLSALHPDDRERAAAASDLADETQEPYLCEYRLVGRDGRVVWVHDEATLIRDEGGVPLYWQGVMFDITERRLAEQALVESERREREAAERLRALDDMKNTFLAAVSHELRSPLTSILGLSLTLEQHELPHDDRVDLLGRLASNARKLDRLLKDLLDIDRLSRGVGMTQQRPTDIGALVRRTVDSLDVVGHRTVVVEAQPVVIPADSPKVERIVENLVANAIRHTQPDIRIWVRVAAHQAGVLIAVEDDGPGIPENLREAIFEPFRQGPTASPHAPGTGIGLSLVKMFADLHGGRAWVEDREGGGSSFRVFLPGLAGGAEPPVRDASPERAPVAGNRNPRAGTG